MLFCSRSAYGQSEPAVSVTYTIDPMAVDLGFSDVYWSKCNSGAEFGNDSTIVGDYYQFSSSLGVYNNNSYWRKPKKDEVSYLIDNTTNIYTNNIGVYLTSKVNSNRILIPASGYKTSPSFLWHSNYALFWTSNDYNLIHAFRFKSTSTETIVNAGTLKESASAERLMYLPFRPVIEKVTLTYQISESKNNTTSEKYSGSVTVPMGTQVTLSPTYDDCWRFKQWQDGNTQNPRTVIVTKDMTLTAIFTVKTTNLEATTKDDRKGEVELQVGDEIE